MFQVNTSVVRALMTLRRISADSLANSLQVSPVDLKTWLMGSVDTSPTIISEDDQMQALKILGISGESLRPDVIHYWYIDEGVFDASAKQDYDSLMAVISSFGAADVIHLDQNSEDLITLKSEVYFMLKFTAGFTSIIKVTFPVFKSHSFHLKVGDSVAWVAESANTAILSKDMFDKLESKRLNPTAIPMIEKSVKSKELANKLADVVADPSEMSSADIVAVLSQVSKLTALEDLDK